MATRQPQLTDAAIREHLVGQGFAEIEPGLFERAGGDDRIVAVRIDAAANGRFVGHYRRHGSLGWVAHHHPTPFGSLDQLDAAIHLEEVRKDVVTFDDDAGERRRANDLREGLNAVRRELRMRNRVYPRQIDLGRMTAEVAVRETGAMLKVLRLLLEMQHGHGTPAYRAAKVVYGLGEIEDKAP